jgi:hypothetical protein
MINLKSSILFLLTAAVAFAVACGDDKTIVQGAPGGTTDAGSSSGRPGDDDDVAAPGDDAGDSGGTSGTQCTAAAKSLLHPQTTVSKGEVKVVSTANGVTKVYVDASAGGSGPGVAASNPRVYLKMDGTKVDISDVDAATSTAWDISFKRVDIFTNSGDGGPGKGAGAVADKKFDDVTAADATGLAQESFFTAACDPKTDEGGFLLTTFSSWYDYDQQTHIPTPFLDRTLVMKAADGTLYKVGLLSYQGKDDGSTTGGATGQYVFQVKKL